MCRFCGMGISKRVRIMKRGRIVSMKKKLVLLCLAGVMIFGVSACGNKNSETTQTKETQTSQPDTEQTQEDTDSTQSVETETEAISDKEDYVAIQDLDIEEYITLTNYKEMKVSATKPVADDASIEDYINKELLVGMITNRSVKKGDIVDIDYVGKKDGVAFQGGTAQGYRLAIGSGSFIPGFEDVLIGVMPKETVDLNLTFPEPYDKNPDLAGQEVVFTVTVNGIQVSEEYQSVTEKDMESMGLVYKTKEELWEAGKKAMDENVAAVFESNAKNAIIQKLVEESDVKSIPEFLVEEEAQNYNNYMESLARSVYGMDFESFITQAHGVTMEEYQAQLLAMCQDTIKQYLVMEAVARAEGIEITEDMMKERASEEADEYGYHSPSELINTVGYTTYRMYLVQDKVLDRLMEIVTVEEETDSEERENS